MQPFVLEVICRAVRTTWGEGFPDLSCDFLLSILSLDLDTQLSKESSNHRKIGDINEALRICKQATQTASV